MAEHPANFRAIGLPDVSKERVFGIEFVKLFDRSFCSIRVLFVLVHLIRVKVEDVCSIYVIDSRNVPVVDFSPVMDSNNVNGLAAILITDDGGNGSLG